jgi:hypothetical protein
MSLRVVDGTSLMAGTRDLKESSKPFKMLKFIIMDRLSGSNKFGSVPLHL